VKADQTLDDIFGHLREPLDYFLELHSGLIQATSQSGRRVSNNSVDYL